MVHSSLLIPTPYEAHEEERPGVALAVCVGDQDADGDGDGDCDDAGDCDTDGVTDAVAEAVGATPMA